MPTNWNRTDINALRAHLQEALAERAASLDPGDWSYSGYEVEAIQAEMNRRQAAWPAPDASEAPAHATSTLRTPDEEAGEADLERIRVLMARWFKAPRHPQQPRSERADGALAFGGRRSPPRHGPHRHARSQRLP